MIKNTLLKYLDKSGNPERLKKSWQFKSFSTNVPIVGKELLMAFYRLVLHFGDSSDLWKKKKKKKCLAKGLIAIWDIIATIILTDLVTNSLLSFFLSFLTNQKQESGFQQVGCLVTKNIWFLFIASVMLYFKAMSNSIDFYKGIFLHVIPVCIIVPR